LYLKFFQIIDSYASILGCAVEWTVIARKVEGGSGNGQRRLLRQQMDSVNNNNNNNDNNGFVQHL